MPNLSPRTFTPVLLFFAAAALTGCGAASPANSELRNMSPDGVPSAGSQSSARAVTTASLPAQQAASPRLQVRGPALVASQSTNLGGGALAANASQGGPNSPGTQCQQDIQLIFTRPGRPLRNLPLVFVAYPENIAPGQSTTLRWNSENVTQVTIDHGVGTFGPNGSVNVSPSENTTYTATASGPSGTVSESVTVAVSDSNLSVTAGVSPATITRGQPATISWTSVNATSVTIDNGIGSVPLSGSLSVTPDVDTVYTMTASCSGGSVTRPLSVSVIDPHANIGKVNHIIYMLQENRSFDHYFGKLGDYRVAQGLPADVDGLPADAVNYANDGTAVHAFKLQTECIEELTAAWNESHWQFNLHHPTSDSPLMDGFVSTAQGYATYQNELDTAGKRAMGYYDSGDLPYYYFMATQFATSDRWFSPVSSQSVPNRLYAFAATSAGFAKPATHTLDTKTIFKDLDDAGVSWKIYYSDTYADGTPVTGIDTFYNYAQQHRSQIVPVNPAYFNDVQNGTLPQVAFIEHGSLSGRDEHPGGANIQVGAQYIASIINGLMNSNSWRDSVFILSYDEAGGLYDHVPSMVNVPSPDGIAPTDLTSSDIQGDFTRTGFRVPMIVVSPFAVKHLVSHTPMDYTAILKFIETRFNLPALTARDAAQPDMTEFFDFVNPPWLTPPTPPVQPLNGPCYLDHLP